MELSLKTEHGHKIEPLPILIKYQFFYPKAKHNVEERRRQKEAVREVSRALFQLKYM
jgi:hypothetical protein